MQQTRIHGAAAGPDQEEADLSLATLQPIKITRK